MYVESGFNVELRRSPCAQ